MIYIIRTILELDDHKISYLKWKYIFEEYIVHDKD
jgi:hypothetical protein